LVLVATYIASRDWILISVPHLVDLFLTPCSIDDYLSTSEENHFGVTSVRLQGMKGSVLLFFALMSGNLLLDLELCLNENS